MNKKTCIKLAIMALCATATNMHIHGLSSSLERNFTRKYGAAGYLVNAPLYYREYKAGKEICRKHKKQTQFTQKRKGDRSHKIYS